MDLKGSAPLFVVRERVGRTVAPTRVEAAIGLAWIAEPLPCKVHAREANKRANQSTINLVRRAGQERQQDKRRNGHDAEKPEQKLPAADQLPEVFSHGLRNQRRLGLGVMAKDFQHARSHCVRVRQQLGIGVRQGQQQVFSPDVMVAQQTCLFVGLGDHNSEAL